MLYSTSADVKTVIYIKKTLKFRLFRVIYKTNVILNLWKTLAFYMRDFEKKFLCKSQEAVRRVVEQKQL